MHGYVLVQISTPAAPSRLVDAGGRRYAPPAAAPGIAPPGHALLPHRPGSAQLLRPGYERASGGSVDSYQRFLATLPDITPSDGLVPPALFDELVPDPSVIDAIPHRRSALKELEARDDPAEDAWGGRSPALVSVPLGKE